VWAALTAHPWLALVWAFVLFDCGVVAGYLLRVALQEAQRRTLTPPLPTTRSTLLGHPEEPRCHVWTTTN
jgi:hypothetical protein